MTRAVGPVPEPGSFVLLRHRHWMVEQVSPAPAPGDAHLVELSGIDDDATGTELTVLWEAEPDARPLGADPWANVGAGQFDPVESFGAYVRALRWNCVTATDPALLQAPFRAGIRPEPYQLEPLRKALLLPRVNLFIADDVGLGKTIEAGLIARELLLRRRADTIVVAAPPGMLIQWREEMEARFGLSFTIMDRERVAAIRRERGWGANPWATGSLFLVSQRLLIDEAYAADLRAWLSDGRLKPLLILDEAHHAAPSSGARYAIDSKITKAVREIAELFQHRLFLSATPHNGHSNSFSALLEILDPQRFVRGVKVRKGDLDAVMVRRLKEDVRDIVGGFPRRNVEQVDIDGLPADAPDLVLADMLAALRDMREARLTNVRATTRNAAMLVLGTLQQRLFSSIEAFARTLRVHAAALEAQPQAAPPVIASTVVAADLLSPPDDDGQEPHDELDDRAFARASAEAGGLPAEITLIRRMLDIADAARDADDARVAWLLRWIGSEMRPGGTWNERRLLIFTEWEDTRRWLERRLRAALADDDRIACYTGATGAEDRERLKAAFNAPPDRNSLRILIATDAAREGLNLQRHCRDLLHFDLPWNPSRLEQRNGRIDRKLQPAPEVTCRYFHFPQRPEDRVLRALVRKSDTIRRDLGSMADVLERRAAALLTQGIRRDRAGALAEDIAALNGGAGEATAAEELEDARERREALLARTDQLRRQLERSGRGLGLTADRLRATLSASLALGGAAPLAPDAAATLDHPETWSLPVAALAADPSWAPTLDALRAPRLPNEPIAAWRARAPVRPVSFGDPGDLGEDAVHLHLEHRVTRRLLARFATQGMLHLDLSRACLATGRAGDARVVLLGRLALYGPGAVRLHEDIIPVTARWTEPAARQAPLRPYGAEGEATTLEMLEEALSAPARRVPGAVQDRLLAAIQGDIANLRPHLEAEAATSRQRAEQMLAQRAERESAELARILAEQRARLERATAGAEPPAQLQLQFPDEAERRQRQADQRAWERRLQRLDREQREEPQRVRDGYTVRAARLEAVGIAYLWPVSG